MPLARRIGRGQAIEARKTLRQRRENAEGRVRALQSLGRRPIQIAGRTRQHLAAQLRKELSVVDGRTVNRGIHLHTDETARTRGVGQHLVHIARGDERGHARQRHQLLPIRAAQGERFELQEVFKRRILPRRVAVELIEIDQPEFRQARFVRRSGGEFKLVGIVVAQFGGHEQAAKGAFAQSLSAAHEERHQVVGRHGGVRHPLRRQRAQPHRETLHPQCVHRDALGQGAQAVAAVPRGELLHEVGEGMVGRDERRVQHALHIALPHPDARIDGVDRQGVEVQGRDTAEGGGRSPLAKFGHLSQQVVAKLVPLFEQAQQLLVKGRRLRLLLLRTGQNSGNGRCCRGLFGTDG